MPTDSIGLLTTVQAAEAMDVSLNTLESWVASGKMPSLPAEDGSGGRVVREEWVRALAGLRRNSQCGGAAQTGAPPAAGRVAVSSIDVRIELEAAQRERDMLAGKLEFMIQSVNDARTEIAYLRGCLERANEAERELRVLLAQTTKALQTALNGLDSS